MKPIFLFAFIVLLLAVAHPASAISYPCADNTTGCGGVYNGDEETGGDGTGASSGKDEWTIGGPFAVCEAWRHFNQKCAYCSFNHFGKPICVAVEATAHCQCTQKRRNPGVVGITDCTTLGQCTYNTI